MRRRQPRGGSLGTPDGEVVSLSWVADQGSEAEPAMAISTLLRWRGHIPQRLRVCGWSWRGSSGTAVDALAVRGQERAGRGGRLDCADVDGGEPRSDAIPLVVAGGPAYLRVGHTLSGPSTPRLRP